MEIGHLRHPKFVSFRRFQKYEHSLVQTCTQKSYFQKTDIFRDLTFSGRKFRFCGKTFLGAFCTKESS